MNEDTKTTHPSFGLIGLIRCSHGGSGANLFGSSIKHGSTMRIHIDSAEQIRSLNRDWYHPTGHFIEVELSPSQFAELITSPGVGPGVPCTIKWTRSEGAAPECPSENKRIQFEQEFQTHIRETGDEVTKLVARTKELCGKPSLLKKEREELVSIAEKIALEWVANIPFILSQWNEQMDATVKEAKGETEAYVSNVIRSVGLKHIESEIRNQFPALE